MRTEHVALRHPPQAMPGVVSLREPCGSDEIAVDGVDTRCAVALLGRLLESVGSMAPELVAPDRDALLAALHRRCWGDRIVTTLTCSRCEQLFDLSFELTAVQRHLSSTDSAWHADGHGHIVNEDGAALQVPRLAQELDAASRDPRTCAIRLAESCGAFSPAARGALAGHGEDSRSMAMEAASNALQATAPIIDLELAASCANCGHGQSAHFDLQSFLLQRLINERENLLAEIHLLASTYGWSLSEILSLARSTRRQLANAVDSLNSRAAARREVWR